MARGRRESLGAAGLAVRSFVAVSLPERVRSVIAARCWELQRECRGGKWVEEENLHLTIKFLGQLDEAALQRVEPVLASCAETQAPFTMALGGLGVFPPRGAPRVLWVGLERGGPEASRLHQLLERGLDELGLVAPDRAGYVPHVTLARARGRRGLVTGGDFLETHGSRLDAESFRVEEVTLFMSELTPRGPIYSAISRVPLRGPDARA